MISFSNEMSDVCGALGDVDVADVMRGVHAARYFTSQLDDGRRVKAPITSFLWAGCGYGGSCLPKDTKALAVHAAERGAPMPLLGAVIETNLKRPARMLALLEPHFSDLRGVAVTVLGLAFKEDTDDLRESPALPLIHALLARGAQVSAFDPIAMPAARAVLPASVRLTDSLEQSLAGANAVMLVTRWEQFRRVPELLAEMPQPPLLVDGRRFLEPGSVPRYAGIGRGAGAGMAGRMTRR
jgi:UDPglucose 6-dehydrogenase/GDP-mannose 6-dehydrogenase